MSNKEQSNNGAMTRGQRLIWMLDELSRRKEEFSGILPPSISFLRFHETVNQALRKNPKLLDCRADSLLNACIQAAADGLNVDGVDAAIVDAREKVKRTSNYQLVARYMPMFQGLRKKVLKSTLVRDVIVTLVYAGDEFQVIGGLRPDLHHIPCGDPAKRGAVIAVYSVAVFKEGDYRTFEYMLRPEIDAIRAMAATDYVWAKHYGEMARKTMLRRHYKALPHSTDLLLDIEARELFSSRLPSTAPLAITEAQPRPTRTSVALEQHHGGNGAPLDLGQDQDFDMVEQNDGAENNAVNGTRVYKTTHTDAKPVTSHQVIDNSQTLPSSEAEFLVWQKEIISHVAKCSDMAACQALQSTNMAIVEAAPESIRDSVLMVIAERIADFASGGSAGADPELLNNKSVE